MKLAPTLALALRTCASSRQIARQCARSFATATPPAHPEPAQPEPNTHFRITLRRSAIGLPSRIKGTLVALGLHRRMHTVYHKHCPDIAGKILAVKELVQVENVPASAVRTKTEQRRERRAPRGYSIVGSKLQDADL